MRFSRATPTIERDTKANSLGEHLASRCSKLGTRVVSHFSIESQSQIDEIFSTFPEIAKVRASLFQISGVKKEPLILPEPEGEITTLTEKVYVPVKEHPDVSERSDTFTQRSQRQRSRSREEIVRAMRRTIECRMLFP